MITRKQVIRYGSPLLILLAGLGLGGCGESREVRREGKCDTSQTRDIEHECFGQPTEF